MARKTTGNLTGSTASKRSKKTEAPGTPIVAMEVKRTKPGVQVPANLEEEIRRRAYELYLQRTSAEGAGNGDENQDWYLAEQEVLSRRNGHQPTA